MGIGINYYQVVSNKRFKDCLSSLILFLSIRHVDEAIDKFIFFYLLGGPSYHLLLHVDIVKLLTTTTYFYKNPPYLLVCEDTLLMLLGPSARTE